MENNFANNVVDNFMKLFFIPEINQRKNRGEIQNDFKLTAAQVIFYPDSQSPLIRLNNEVSGNLKLKEIEIDNEKRQQIQEIKLNEKKFENCGHATFIFFDNTVHISFDFQRNKEIVKRYLSVAKEFFSTAIFAKEKKLKNAFIDNAFSSMELLIKASMLLEPNSNKDKENHKNIKSQYHRRTKNVNDPFEKKIKRVFKILENERPNARYLKNNISLNDLEINTISETISQFIEELTYKIS